MLLTAGWQLERSERRGITFQIRMRPPHRVGCPCRSELYLLPTTRAGDRSLHRVIHQDYICEVCSSARPIRGPVCPTRPGAHLATGKGVPLPIADAPVTERGPVERAAPEDLPVADPDKLNAVSIMDEFYGRGEVYPDILDPSPRVATRLTHGCTGAARSRRSTGSRTQACRDGRRVVRVRLDGLDVVDHAECVSGTGVSKRIADRIVELVSHWGRREPRDEWR